MSEDSSRKRQPVWSFRGYRLSPGEFNTAMVHLYRGEVSRSNTWRIRLDTTTNWALVSTAGLLTFAFGTADHHHVTILLAMVFALFFLVLEARRYRYYELWSLRIRLMETDFFGAMLAPPFSPGDDWARSLNETLLNPTFPITHWEALGRRLRRNYIWTLLILAVSWLTKLAIHPVDAGSLGEMVSRAAIGPAPGWLVMLGVLAFYTGLLLLAGLTVGLQSSAGEVLPRKILAHFSEGVLEGLSEAAHKVIAEETWPFRRHKYLTFIITERNQEVGEQMMSLLKHGVTELVGTGMYSGQTRHLLLCAVAGNEIDYLKSLVYAADPQAFIVVNPVEEVYGTGFEDLRPGWRRHPS
jgi:uncharacterized membrane protein